MEFLDLIRVFNLDFDACPLKSFIEGFFDWSRRPWLNFGDNFYIVPFLSPLSSCVGEC